LMGLPAHLPAEGSERGEFAVVLDVGWRRVAVDNHWLVQHESGSPLVVSPDALGLG
jgi:hypothetical protein